MIVDSRTEVSDAQALTATAASTDTIDLEQDRNIGPGQQVFLVITVDVALAGTSPTFQATIQTDDNSAFSSATSLVSSQTFTALAAGDQIVIPFTYDNERHIRVNYTLGGTTPTTTVSAWFTHHEPTSWTSFPDAVN